MEEQTEQHQKWWQQIRKHPVASVLIALFLTLVVLVILGGYKFNWGWAGFNRPSKTLWDWLQLLGVLAIPVMVGFGAAWFSYRQNMTTSRIAEDHQREAVLQAYLDKMSELILANHLRESAEDKEARQIARARTLTTLSRLDGVRKRSALQFLYEAHLFNIFDWSYADLSKAALSEATLSGANLSRATLSGANLSFADLSGAQFSGADLSGADFTGADLSGADLTETSLSGASLSGANLSRANLSGAYLYGANLSKIMHWYPVSTTQRQFLRNYDRGGPLRKLVSNWHQQWNFLGDETLTMTFKNGTNLSGANLSRAQLYRADLSDANLEGASLKEADLVKTNLTRANLKDANLTEAKMSRAKRTVVVRPLIPFLAQIPLFSTERSTHNMEWADLEKGFPVDSREVHLSTAEAKNLLEKLEKSNGNKARLKVVDLKTFSSKVVKLEAVAADLQEADLTGATLTGATLTGANLSGAMLIEANLKYAKITDEQLNEAQSLKGATMPDGSIHP